MKKEGVCGMDAATQRPHIVGRPTCNSIRIGDYLSMTFVYCFKGFAIARPFENSVNDVENLSANRAERAAFVFRVTFRTTTVDLE